MIEINLLSEELQPKAKKPGGDYTYLIYVGGFLVFAVIIFIHLCLFLFTGLRSYRLMQVNNKLRNLEPQKKAAEDFKAVYDLVAQDEALVKQLTTQSIIWSEKLNKFSLNLPYGMWFNEIFVNPEGGFVLRGSVVSMEKTGIGSIGLINKFIDNLKKDKDFFKDFEKLEPSFTKARVVGDYDILDFTLNGQLKIK